MENEKIGTAAIYLAMKVMPIRQAAPRGWGMDRIENWPKVKAQYNVMVYGRRDIEKSSPPAERITGDTYIAMP